MDESQSMAEGGAGRAPHAHLRRLPGAPGRASRSGCRSSSAPSTTCSGPTATRSPPPRGALGPPVSAAHPARLRPPAHRGRGAPREPTADGAALPATCAESASACSRARTSRGSPRSSRARDVDRADRSRRARPGERRAPALPAGAACAGARTAARLGRSPHVWTTRSGPASVRPWASASSASCTPSPSPGPPRRSISSPPWRRFRAAISLRSRRRRCAARTHGEDLRRRRRKVGGALPRSRA